MVKVSRKDLKKIERFLTVRRWLRDKAAKTRYSYLRNMVRLTRELKLNPDQFLAWAKTKDSLEVWDRIEEMAETVFQGPGARFNFKTDMRSFLAHNGYNNLPKAKNGYSSEDWHRGYRKEELRNLVGFLDLSLRYRHVKQDLEAGVLPVAVRLEKSFYGKKKSAGYTFIGSRGVSKLKECIAQGLVKTDDDSPLIPRKKDLSKPLSYSSIHDNLVLAAKKAGVPSTTQPSHGIRKYFEGCLDRADIDHEQKMMMEGHFEGTRAKNYTDRDWDNPHWIRESYAKAYPFIDLDAGDPELAQTVQSWQQEKAELVGRIYRLEEEKKNRNLEVQQLKDTMLAQVRDMAGKVVADLVKDELKRREKETDKKAEKEGR